MENRKEKMSNSSLKNVPSANLQIIVKKKNRKAQKTQFLRLKFKTQIETHDSVLNHDSDLKSL